MINEMKTHNSHGEHPMCFPDRNVSNLPAHLERNGTKTSRLHRVAAVLGIGLLLVLGPSLASATIFTVTVGDGGFIFSPSSLTIQPGDTVKWTWSASGHSSTSGTPGSPTGIWNSGILNQMATFTHTFNSVGSFPYFCSPHGACCGMTGTITVAIATPTPTPAATPTPTPSGTPPLLLNISTRMRVQTGDNVLIGGLIITGTDPKKVMIRGIGPSLAAFIPGALADPTLELDQGATLLASNDNWRDTQETEIAATGIAPANDLESAIVRILTPGNYTATLRGKNNTTGIGVVEAYDLDQAANSQLANISTRGFVETGDNVMIGGLILGPADRGIAGIVVRAIGPTLSNFGISGALQDPTLDLVDSNGAVIRSNNNWKDSQQTEIQAVGLQPGDDRESALLQALGPGDYTAIVRGVGGTTGVALVEVYNVVQ
jgi:plastocyanin